MKMSITLESEVKEKLVGSSLFTVRVGRNQTVNKDLFTFESILSNSVPERNRESIANKCVEIANDAHFPTDYDDVYDHLFGGNYELAFLKYNNELKGFAVFDILNIDDKKVLHLHGIIISQQAQYLWQHKKAA